MVKKILEIFFFFRKSRDMFLKSQSRLRFFCFSTVIVRQAYHQSWGNSSLKMIFKNLDPPNNLISELRAEIERLRGEQGGGGMNEEALAASMSEISRLKNEMEEMSRSWQERLRQAEARKAEELKLLEVCCFIVLTPVPYEILW